jgi:hypothetical protein
MTGNNHFEDFHKDFLSERTYRERHVLLVWSAIVLAIVLTGLVPSKISALGIEFSLASQKTMFWLMAALIVYLLLSFLIHAWADLVAYKTLYAISLRTAKLRQIDSEKSDEELQRTLDMSKNKKVLIAMHQTMPPGDRFMAVSVRRWFDLATPVVLAALAILAALVAR